MKKILFELRKTKKRRKHCINNVYGASYYVLRGIRTPDRRLRRPLLYPAELSGQMALSFQQPNTILCLNRLFVNGFL